METGARSGLAIKVPETEKLYPAQGENTNDYIAPRVDGLGGKDRLEEKEEEEEEDLLDEKVDWKEGYEMAILRLLQLMTDVNVTMRRQVKLCRYL